MGNRKRRHSMSDTYAIYKQLKGNMKNQLTSSCSHSHKNDYNVLVVTKTEAKEFLPNLEHYRASLRKACVREAVNPDHAAIVLSQGEVKVNNFHTPSPVLVANLPSSLEPYLAEIVRSQPKYEKVKSAKNFGAVLLTWTIKDQLGQLFKIGFEIGVIEEIITIGEPTRPEDYGMCRLVFCCGNQVAFTSFIFNDDVTNGVNYQDHLIGTGDADRVPWDEFLNDGNSENSPWIGDFWLSDDGSKLIQIPYCAAPWESDLNDRYQAGESARSGKTKSE